MEEPAVAIVRSYRATDAGSGVRAVKARRVRLKKNMPAADAFRAMVLECLAQVEGNTAAIRARNRHGVHQLRVGLRRMQMALLSFASGVEPAALKTLSKRGRALAKLLGPARDLDVFAEELLPPIARKFGEDESFVALQLAVTRARRKAWSTAQGAILGPDFAALLNEVAAAAETLPPPATNIVALSERVLEELYRKVRKRARRSGLAYDVHMHKLRIALKKLRYAAEFFAPLYARKRSAKYLKELKRLLDDLGEANDAHGVGALLEPLGDGPQLCFAKGVVAGWYAAREKRLTRRAAEGWRAFKQLRPFWS